MSPSLFLRIRFPFTSSMGPLSPFHSLPPASSSYSVSFKRSSFPLRRSRKQSSGVECSVHPRLPLHPPPLNLPSDRPSPSRHLIVVHHPHCFSPCFRPSCPSTRSKLSSVHPLQPNSSLPPDCTADKLALSSWIPIGDISSPSSRATSPMPTFHGLSPARPAPALRNSRSFVRRSTPL